MLSISTQAPSDCALPPVLDAFTRRVSTMPPGTCPIAVQAAQLRTGAAQTCGKCVPCRDGLPQLAELLERVARCEVDATALDQIRELATTVRDASDCAIGYQAAQDVLDGLEAFSAEYASHVERRRCQEGMGQKVPCEALCPAHVDVPGYIALVAAGDCAGAVARVRKDNPFPTACALVCEHPCEMRCRRALIDAPVNIRGAAGDCAGAVARVRKDNPFPTACALVCEHPCEMRCRRALIDAPVNIRGIKLFAVDNAPADTVPTPARLPETGRRVAVVGGGPSGLTCAYYLALMGHDVTVLEEKARLGGMLRYGIPAYRFPRERLDEDIRAILGVGGITVELEMAVDAERMAGLCRDYDAVYVAAGAHAAKGLGLPNEDAPGVTSAVDLLRAVGDGAYPDFSGKDVVVVGGGNVAMDCARTAVRAGAASVSVVYRRRREDMTALDAEVDAAVAEGVELLTLESPASIEVGDDGAVTALLTQPQVIGAVRGGRPAPRDAAKPQRRIPADQILVAVGQAIASSPFEESGLAASRGRLQANDQLRALLRDGSPQELERVFVGGDCCTGPATVIRAIAAGKVAARNIDRFQLRALLRDGSPQELERVFVGGDCCTGPATVIRAIAAGKVAARNIDRFLGYDHALDCGAEPPAAKPNDRTPCGRVDVAERPARERKRDFAGVELGMSAEEAAQECGRCLRCDRYGCGTLTDGRVIYA